MAHSSIAALPERLLLSQLSHFVQWHLLELRKPLKVAVSLRKIDVCIVTHNKRKEISSAMRVRVKLFSIASTSDLDFERRNDG